MKLLTTGYPIKGSLYLICNCFFFHLYTIEVYNNTGSKYLLYRRTTFNEKAPS